MRWGGGNRMYHMQWGAKKTRGLVLNQIFSVFQSTFICFNTCERKNVILLLKLLLKRHYTLKTGGLLYSSWETSFLLKEIGCYIMFL